MSQIRLLLYDKTTRSYPSQLGPQRKDFDVIKGKRVVALLDAGQFTLKTEYGLFMSLVPFVNGTWYVGFLSYGKVEYWIVNDPCMPPTT